MPLLTPRRALLRATTTDHLDLPAFARMGQDGQEPFVCVTRTASAVVLGTSPSELHSAGRMLG